MPTVKAVSMVSNMAVPPLRMQTCLVGPIVIAAAMVMTRMICLGATLLMRVSVVVRLGIKCFHMEVAFLLHLGLDGLIHLIKLLVRVSWTVFIMMAMLAAAPMYAAVSWFHCVSMRLPFTAMVSNRVVSVAFSALAYMWTYIAGSRLCLMSLRTLDECTVKHAVIVVIKIRARFR